MPERFSFFRFKAATVVGADLTVGSDGVAEKLLPLPPGYRIAMVRGHGSFAVDQMPGEPFQWTSSLGASCRAPLLLRLPSPLEDRGGEEKW